MMVGLGLGKGEDYSAKYHEYFGVQLPTFQALQTWVCFAQIDDQFIFLEFFQNGDHLGIPR